MNFDIKCCNSASSWRNTLDLIFEASVPADFVHVWRFCSRAISYWKLVAVLISAGLEKVVENAPEWMRLHYVPGILKEKQSVVNFFHCHTFNFCMELECKRVSPNCVV